MIKDEEFAVGDLVEIIDHNDWPEHNRRFIGTYAVIASLEGAGTGMILNLRSEHSRLLRVSRKAIRPALRQNVL